MLENVGNRCRWAGLAVALLGITLRLASASANDAASMAWFGGVMLGAGFAWWVMHD